MLKEAIGKVVKGEDLTLQEATESMNEIMSGQATPSQIAAFITALRMKGETVEEITGCAKVMREKALHINVDKEAISIDRDDINIDTETIVDTCGTGGDGTNTFNVSTATAFVVAGGNLLVAKHGNRSVSSQCGSADVVRSLGVNIDIPAEKVKECLEKVGIGFLFAPLYHSAMKYALPTRREIGIRTIFNILGPLTNPAGATVQVMGVYSPKLTEPLAQVLKNLGTKACFVVHGEESFDEISITGRSKISQLKDGGVKTYYIQPEDFGMKSATLEDIRGGNAAENAEIIIKILEGEKSPRRDMVLLNAGAAFQAADRAENMEGGIELARQSIDSGRAKKKLEDLIQYTNA